MRRRHTAVVAASAALVMTVAAPAVALAASSPDQPAATSGSASAQHSGPAKPTATVAETPEHQLVHWINVDRAQHGLRALAPAADLTAIAHRHTAAMAAAGLVFHDARLTAEVHDWQSLGEDVGSGATLGDLERAFVADRYDRANVRGPGFRQVGVGVERNGGLIYVTVVVRRPETVSPA